MRVVSRVCCAALVLSMAGCEGGGAGGPGVEPPFKGNVPGGGFVADVGERGGDSAIGGGSSATSSDGGPVGPSDGAQDDAGSPLPDAGDAAGAGIDAGGAVGVADDQILITEPLFFTLPINSIRYAVSGWDEAKGLCVTAVWFFSGPDDMVQHCDDFGEMFPYVVIALDEPSGCWDYAATADLLAASGCVDWAIFGPGHADQVELELEVTSAYWSGTIRFDNTP